MNPASRLAPLLTILFCLPAGFCAAEELRLRVIVETDAGGDPDDEQSLVRFLVYANEWDLAGIIANRPRARDGENKNPERTGLGIVRALVNAYGQCHANLVRHDPLGALYRTNTGLAQKEGDTMTFLYLVPTGMNDPNEPTWGSWAGRYGPHEEFPGKEYVVYASGGERITGDLSGAKGRALLARWYDPTKGKAVAGG